MRGADAERGELGELLSLRLLAGEVEQLQDAERRASQRQRGRDGARLWQPGGMGADRPGFGKRPLRQPTRLSEIGDGVDAPGGSGNEPAALAALPEDRRRRSGDAGSEANDLRGRILLLHRDRECLACQFERGSPE